MLTLQWVVRRDDERVGGRSSRRELGSERRGAGRGWRADREELGREDSIKMKLEKAKSDEKDGVLYVGKSW